MDLQLKDKLIIVTGSTGDGIGKHIAEELWVHGAYVVINGRSQGSVDKTIQGLKEKHSSLDASKLLGVPGDVSSGEGATAFIDTIKAQEDKLGVMVYGLVNNVGIFEAKDFQEVTDEKWAEYYQTNTMSGVRLSRYFLPLFLERNEGRILFISSECGVRPLPHMLPYSVSKCSQISLSRGLAEMTKGSKVTVNTILPGPTMTGGVRKYMEDFAELKKISSFDEAVATYFKDAEPTSLLQRFLDPKEIADVSAFLLSPLASGVNGHAQHVDGGLVRHI